MVRIEERERSAFGGLLRDVHGELASLRQGRVPFSSAIPSEWRRLSTDVIPIPGESLRGLVTRSCRANDLPNSWGLLQHLGQSHRNRVLVSEDQKIDPAELAYAIRVTEEEVRSRRYEPLGAGRVSFFGINVNGRRIETSIRRFSPAAFSLERGHFHRAAWELRDLPFCLEAWDMLQDRCGCEGSGIIQGWTRTLTAVHECDKCGDPLEWVEPVPVPEDMKPALSIIEALVEPRPKRREAAAARLPADLRRADRSAIYDLIVHMARSIDPHGAGHAIEDAAERLHGLHQACQALRSWPEGFEDIHWHADAEGKAINSMRSDWLALKPGVLIEDRKPSARRYKRRGIAVGIRPATEIANLSPEILLAAWDHELVTRHYRVHGPRVVPAFDPNEMAAFGRRWRARVEPQTLARQIGISLHGVEQLVVLRVIEPDGVALPGSAPHFTTESVSGFVARLEASAMERLVEGVRLKDVLSRIGGGAKPWGPIIKSLVGGRLRFALAPEGTIAERIQIECKDASRVLSMTFDRRDHPDFVFAKRMVQRDALEVLNISHAGKRLLDGLPFQGTNPRTYAVADVERRAATIISVAEFAAKSGVCPQTAYQQLAAIRGSRELIPGGWDRTITGNFGFG